MIRALLSLFIIALLGGMANAQKTKTESPKRLVKQAVEFEKSGDYYRAAVYYWTAYIATETKKPDLEYAYNSGRCYLEARDYANAVKALKVVKDRNDVFDMPGFKYALALKQNADPETAKTEFENFIASYYNFSSPDKKPMKDIVEMEIKGCDFALRAKDHTDAGVEIQHLDARINTDKTEFGPVPSGNNGLYFSSSVSGVASIYKSEKNGDQWSNRKTPDWFGKMEKTHFGNGSFTPDGKRFYFTQCDLKVGSKPQCDIYVLEESGGKWSNPARLPDYINPEGANTTHPHVTLVDGKEILYFATDREGGKGGLDLWYCTRTGDKGNDFTLPKNLGRNINTEGDEITPYYDSANETLYFSSNGWVSAGGLDIFSSKGSKLKWDLAQNHGFPANSEADDLYYTISEEQGGGFLVSNRRFEKGNRVTTTNDDIFYFGKAQAIEVLIEGKVTACDGEVELEDIQSKLFELVDGEEELVKQRMSIVGEYKFKLEAEKEYVIEISKPGSDFTVATFELGTFDFYQNETVNKDVCLLIPQEPEDPSMDRAEVLSRIVPPEYDSRENPYTLPLDPPEGFEEGTPEYSIWEEVEEIAGWGDERQLYYEDAAKTKISPYSEEAAVVDDPPENETGFPWRRNWENEEGAYEAEPEIRYKLQVSAVRYYKENRYKELFDLQGVKMAFEPIDGDITRVLIVPREKDGGEGFLSKGDALDALKYIHDMTDFDRAFVSRYEDQSRVGEGFRGWEEENN